MVVNMQIDCYMRNFHSEVCTVKCKFFEECSREYSRVKKIPQDDLQFKTKIQEIKEKLERGEFL